jgi:hypothetical protein
MTTTQIFISFASWAIATFIVFAIARKHRTERSSLYAGMAFLLLTIAGLLTVQTAFASALQCQSPNCMASKAMVDTFTQFLLITWGALAGSLLAKTIENKN